MTVSEDQLVQWFMEQRALPEGRFPIGIGDDMAEIRLAGREVLITTDMLLEGAHFDLRTATLEQVGYKAMAASLSDCAAMATRPLAAVVAVGLPRTFRAEDLRTLHAGLLRAADAYDCPIVGGDMTRWAGSAGLVVNVSMLSEPAGSAPVQRSGALVGDSIAVTGTLGGSLAGRHLRFEPRVREALRLVEIAPIHAMMDLSDGLSTDLRRICRLSGVGALIQASKIPCSDQARRGPDPIRSALNDGEDFELLFTLDPTDLARVHASWDRAPAITEIGIVTNTDKVQIQDLTGRVVDLPDLGYDHFRHSHATQ